MTGSILLYFGSAVAFIWGVAHIAATRPVVRGFGDISIDNRRILTMEWIAGGIALCFIGLLVGLVTASGSPGNQVSKVVYIACAAALLSFVGLTAVTGFRTSVAPVKACPFVDGTAAILIITGALL
jgi:hypothetical protein